MNSINDTIVSTRLRLARNVDGLPFPHKIAEAPARQIADKVEQALVAADKFKRYDMSDISDIEGTSLRENHLISPDLLEDSPFGSVLISADGNVSVMVCATNRGTGMRASVMMFLPALTIENMMDSCINDVGRLNMTVRGVYGEGSKADGYLYQISNQRTLGLKESDILDAVKGAINHIVDAELRARQLLKRNEPELKDKIYRAYGIAANAYKLATGEAMQYLAMVRLGGYYGYFDISDDEQFQKVITSCQPANMQKMGGADMTVDERDILYYVFDGR